jgi:gliding motility-associated-like protein
MNFGSLDGSGADGIAFVMQPISTALGSGGGGMGYLGINPSIDIEFDTYQNSSPYNDPFQDHVAINSDGDPTHFVGTSLTAPVNILAGSINAEDGIYHDVLFQWDVSTLTLSVTVDCNLRTSYTGDIVNTIFGSDPLVYIGFTAGTGALYNNQSICFDYLEIGLGPESVSACEGDTVYLEAPLGFSSYSWSPSGGFDNPFSPTPELIASTSGIYTVSFTDDCGTIFIDSFDLSVTPLPVFNLGNDTTLCDVATLDLIAPAGFPVITWSDGTAGSNITVSSAGTYWLEMGAVGCSSRDSIDIAYLNPALDLGPDSSCLAAEDLIGPLDDPAYTYSWNTGENTSQIEVTESGWYNLQLSESICSVEDSIFIEIQDSLMVLLPDSLSWCPDEVLDLSVSGNALNYTWSDGSKEELIEVSDAGIVWVDGFSALCVQRDSTVVFQEEFCFCDPVFPNAFSPNADGLNDIFRARNVDRCPVAQKYQLQIYNRYGEVVYIGRDPLDGWDGSFQGKDAELATYIFVLDYQFESPQSQRISGTVTLIR